MQTEENQINTKDKILILIPCYKREIGLLRIVDVINNIPDKKSHLFELIISQDGGGSTKLTELLESIQIKLKNKIFIHDENLGLKKHILNLCDQVINYRACVVVEDDIFLTKSFHKALLDLIDLVEDGSNIAGASLYSPSYNEYANSLFYPIKNENNFYKSSVPSSWGQIWTNKTWLDFRDWLRKKTNANIESSNLPEYVKKWPDTSWKKYLALYLLEENKKIIYPYTSYATNMCDEGGEHIERYTNLFQVDIGNISKDISIKKINENIIDYDSHFNLNVIHFKHCFPSYYKELIVDLYSTKNISQEKGRYVLTRALFKKGYINSYSDKLIPLEMNIFLKDSIKDKEERIFLIEKQKYLSYRKKIPYFESNIKVSIFKFNFIIFYFSTVYKKCLIKLKNYLK